MYMLAQTAWLHISCISKKYTSAYGVMLCFSCAAKCRSPGNSVVCDGVLCKFLVQSQLAYSGSKLQLNSGKLTDLIRKSWITLLSLQPIKLIPISEHAEANHPVFSRTARLCLITIFPAVPAGRLCLPFTCSFPSSDTECKQRLLHVQVLPQRAVGIWLTCTVW